MIGFYDYTVILTLLSLVLSIIGMTQAVTDHFGRAILLLALSGLLDGFDGKVARTKKNRTDDEKLYGIQLDSLVDVVCFGIFPILLCFRLGLQTGWDVALFCLYGLCGVIRLAFFNVVETNRQMKPNAEEKIYHGMPITSIAVLLPLAYLTIFVMAPTAFTMVLRSVMLVSTVLFVVDFRLKAIKNWQIACLVVLVGIAAFAAVRFS